MVETLLRIALAALLVASAAGKLAAPAQTRAAMATYGFDAPAAQWGAWLAVLAAELTLAVGVAAGSRSAYLAAAGLMLLLAATLRSALMQGRAGAPCGCFGPRSTVSAAAVGRNLLLAAAFVVLAAASA